MQSSPYRLLSPAEIEAEYGPRLSVLRLQEMRSARKGPAWRRIGRAVVYRRSDVEAWLAGSLVDPPAASTAHAIITALGKGWGDGVLHDGLLAAERRYKRLLRSHVPALIAALVTPRPFGPVPDLDAIVPDQDDTMAFTVSTPSGTPVVIRYDMKTEVATVGDEAPWACGAVDLLACVFTVRQGRTVTAMEVVEHLAAVETIARVGLSDAASEREPEA